MRLTSSWPGRPSWASTSPAGKTLAVLAVLLGLFAVLLVGQASASLPRRQLVEVAGPTAPYVDAAGCPTGASCRAGTSAPPALLTAIGRAFPGSVVTFTAGVADSSSGQPYRVSLLVQVADGVTVRLDAQRLPGQPANDPARDDALADRSRTDLSGNSVLISHTLQVRAAGRPGCSLNLLLYALTGGDRYDAALRRLAQDPEAQLTP
ncbi:MAG: hypothetical protein M3Y77_14610 [Actinomycetota bacterium]|nr:hypothetical protein [Actinomycetota bacterium]MDQ2956632.1 hypothetical protein [Actinomycetota bacterium]